MGVQQILYAMSARNLAVFINLCLFVFGTTRMHLEALLGYLRAHLNDIERKLNDDYLISKENGWIIFSMHRKSTGREREQM